MRFGNSTDDAQDERKTKQIRTEFPFMLSAVESFLDFFSKN
jgi:hypothetical protein